MAFEAADFGRWQWESVPEGVLPLHISRLPAYAPENLVRDPGFLGPAQQSATHLGNRALRAQLSRLYQVPEGEILITMGATGANYLALATLCDPGDAVAIENPGYGGLRLAAEAAHLRILPIARPADRGFQPDLKTIEGALEAGAKVILLSDLHNPSGMALDEQVFTEIKALATSYGAWVLVDEVYRDFARMASPRAWRAGGGNIVSTSSLSKVYGLSYLRVGWMMAPEAMLERAWPVLEGTTGMVPVPLQAMARLALDEREKICRWAQSITEPALALLARFQGVERRLTIHLPQFGTLAYVGLPPSVQADAFFAHLLEKYGVRVAPGHFFGAPQGFRLGLGLGVDELRRGLAKISRTLDDLGA